MPKKIKKELKKFVPTHQKVILNYMTENNASLLGRFILQTISRIRKVLLNLVNNTKLSMKCVVLEIKLNVMSVSSSLITLYETATFKKKRDKKIKK